MIFVKTPNQLILVFAPILLSVCGQIDLTGRNAIEITSAREEIRRHRDVAFQSVLTYPEERPVLRQGTQRLDLNVRPLVGGLSITRGVETGSCTLGFVAIHNGTPVFITNSHCTSSTFAKDNSKFYQDFIDPANQIGIELKDPNTEYCWLWSQLFSNCRYSDASAIALFPGVTFELGRIARPIGKNFVNAHVSTIAKTIDSENPYLSIDRSTDIIANGMVLNKVGSTTGWTDGTVTQTCVHVDYGGDAFWALKCQYKVTGTYVWEGDSGSPVFRILTSMDYTQHASLMGILYAGGPTGFWFSPMSGIRNDIGSLIVEDPNNTYIAPPPVTGCGGCDVVEDPCVENPLLCHIP